MIEFGIVCIILGELKISFDSYDEAIDLAVKIREDWENQHDIKSDEEFGYISAYAHRVLGEMLENDALSKETKH